MGKKSFSVAFWLKVNELPQAEDANIQLLSVANKQDTWPKTDWGWIWCNINRSGQISNFTFRGTDATNNNELKYMYENTAVPVGNWAHLTFVFEYNASGNFRADLYLNGVKQKITSWKRTTDGENTHTTDPGYQKDVYNITNGQVLAVGGNAHGRSGIDGVIDNLQVWNKVMTAEEVITSMGDFNKNALPSGLAAFWDFETKAVDNAFDAVGSKAGVKAGLHEYIAQGGEGQGVLTWVAPEYTSGCPFIIGTSYPVTTLPTWTTKKGTLSEETGNDKAGSAKVTYAKGGDYTVTLTLANSLGEDSRTFQVIKVEGKPDGITTATGADIKTYTVGESLFIDFAEAGNYDVRVYDIAGKQVAAKAQALSAGNKMQVSLGQAGTYVLRVVRDGEVVRTVKLLRK